jgi:hypothetical protein
MRGNNDDEDVDKFAVVLDTNRTQSDDEESRRSFEKKQRKLGKDLNEFSNQLKRHMIIALVQTVHSYTKDEEDLQSQRRQVIREYWCSF